MSRGAKHVYERGVDGWYDAVEVTGDLLDTLHIGSVIKLSDGFYKVVGVSRKIKPERGGAVVRLEAQWRKLA